ncbi:hypothetical protein [Streptomyces gobiensis]|uniref:hypothetical protein n=1 Tax=Streptomyces gobiensis TaxID=2875706 RepID=UPI001E3393D5|nr:hypothetical protein [Streptomyces gobiensis]UGY91039.1 hypothetical protein test1122_04410 [Streptomyces gobiensis]
MTAPAHGQLAPHCRLATDRPEYADEHQRCRGDEAVRIPGELPLVTQRCACDCHQHEWRTSQ